MASAKQDFVLSSAKRGSAILSKVQCVLQRHSIRDICRRYAPSTSDLLGILREPMIARLGLYFGHLLVNGCEMGQG